MTVTAGSPAARAVWCVGRPGGAAESRRPGCSGEGCPGVGSVGVACRVRAGQVSGSDRAAAGAGGLAGLCGWTLARAHARSGDRVALAAYLGGSTKFDQAIAEFAETYADQNERDYAALQTAVKDGKAETTTHI
jgi:Uncharacterized protein conserved in bacteria (DUF2252)